MVRCGGFDAGRAMLIVSGLCYSAYSSAHALGPLVFDEGKTVVLDSTLVELIFADISLLRSNETSQGHIKSPCDKAPRLYQHLLPHFKPDTQPK